MGYLMEEKQIDNRLLQVSVIFILDNSFRMIIVLFFNTNDILKCIFKTIDIIIVLTIIEIERTENKWKTD
jgi:hypothetical protein